MGRKGERETEREIERGIWWMDGLFEQLYKPSPL